MVDCGHYLISHWDADSSRWKQLGAVLLNIKGEQLSHRQTSGVSSLTALRICEPSHIRFMGTTPATQNIMIWLFKFL